MATETVKVTKADIQEANLRYGTNDYDPYCECPIAEAVRQRHPQWQVFDSYIWADLGRIALPPIAVEFVTQFDAEQPVEPFEFEIEV